MSLSFKGIGETVITFNGYADVGDIVNIEGNSTVSKALADKDIIGVCVSTNNDIVGVLIKGVVTLKYTGNAPTLGYNSLVTAGSNSVKVSASGIKYLVLDLNTTTKDVTILL